MKIAVSADCFSSFTSGFPVRGMMLNLIQMRKQDTFVLYYTKRETPKILSCFYDKIHDLNNVEVRYYKYSRTMVAFRRLFGFSLIPKTNEFSLFLNPGCPETCSSLGVPQICSIADFSTLKGHSTGKYAWFYKYFNRWAFKRSFEKIDRIISISHHTKKDLLSFWPQFKSKLFVVYNGIDDLWFNDKVIRCDCNPFKGEPYFIWWGLVSRRKNVETLIEAYKLAKNECSNLPNLLLIGRVEQYMTSIIRGLLNKNIQIIPFQETYVLKDLVQNSSGLIFPSFYEGFGLPVIEAFSRGVPVACSNVSSLPEIVNGHALLFNPYDVLEMKAKIIQLADRHWDKQELIEHAKKYTYYRAAQSYSQIIDNLIC